MEMVTQFMRYHAVAGRSDKVGQTVEGSVRGRGLSGTAFLSVDCEWNVLLHACSC